MQCLTQTSSINLSVFVSHHIYQWFLQLVLVCVVCCGHWSNFHCSSRFTKDGFSDPWNGHVFCTRNGLICYFVRTSNWFTSPNYPAYVWFKCDLGQNYYALQGRPDWDSNSGSSDHDGTFHVTAMTTLTSWPSVTSADHDSTFTDVTV